MATTMELIESVTLGSTATSVTFSSIPGTMTDLLLVCSLRDQGSGTQSYAEVTSNLGASSGRALYTFSGTVYSATTFLQVRTCSTLATANTFASGSVYIPNYAGSTNKSASAESASEDNSANGPVILIGAALWASTSAITSLTITPANPNLVSGSSAFLYGITKS